MEILKDTASEIALLSSIAQHGKQAYLDASDLVTSQSFTMRTNQYMFTVLSHIYNKNMDAKVDYHLVLSAAKDLGLVEEVTDNKNYLERIFTFPIEAQNTREFAQRIRKLQETNGLIHKLDDAINELRKVTGSESMSAIVAKAEEPIFGFINKLTIDGNNQVEQIGIGLDEYVAEREENPLEIIGIPTCYPIWQDIAGGIAEGVHMVTARPKAGKSTFGINVGLYVSLKEHMPVLYLDTELNKRSGTWDRMLSRLSSVPFTDIRKGQYVKNEVHRRRVHKAKEYLKKIPLDYMNITGKDFEEVTSTIRRWLVQKVGYNDKGRLNKCLLIYDYLKLTKSTEATQLKEYEAIGYRMSGLHDLTNQYIFPCITFCQLNRELDVSQSDRIRWFCTSMCSLQKKTEEEIAQDGRENGNRKLVPEDFRFGPGLDDGDYINFQLDGKFATLKEMKTRNQLGAERNNGNQLEPEPVDQDF
jgi:replicative DNA helicase